MTFEQTLVLAAHGAGDGSRSNERVRELAQRVAERRRDLRVKTAFKLGTPTIDDVLASVRGADAVVLPLMTSAGYFAGEYLRERAAGIARVLPAIGLDRRITTLCTEEVQRAVKDAGPSATGEDLVLVVGHGTRRSAASGDSTRELAQAIHGATGIEAIPAFLDQDPLLEDLAPGLGARRLIVLPFLLGGGGHHVEDIPQRLSSVPEDRVRILPALAQLDGFEDVLLKRIDEACARPRVRLGTRGSVLARWQAERVADALRAVGADVEMIAVDTEGDLNLSTPIEGFATDGPFTDALERALLDGRIDAAAHSVKDLPAVLGPGTRLGAVLPRGPVEEVLVSRHKGGLSDLPFGATIGTCSTRRAAQVRRLRPDLVILPIRGTVEHRVQQVKAGAFDAAVLARAGLQRLGLEQHISEIFSLRDIVPEAGQGAVGVQVRDGDDRAGVLVAEINDETTRWRVEEERKLCAAIERDTGLTAAAVWVGERVHVRVISQDGRMAVDASGTDAQDAIGGLTRRGCVALVGAGPGDPGLITVRGRQLLHMAEVVIADRLAGTSLLDELGEKVEIIDAGKSPGRHTLPQDRINELMVRRARAGCRVVRLKGGDPFVYGRGWEELEHCRRFGVACEVVPGVSSALAGPTAAMVPVTARGVSRSFAVVTPQSESGAERKPLDYAALARMDTGSVLMGRSLLGEVVEGFLGAGRRGDTPAVIVQSATLPDQRIVRGTLATIVHLAETHEISAPSVLVIGDSAGLATKDRRAAVGRFAGRRVVVTRPRSASAGLIAELKREGAEVVDCPLIRIEYGVRGDGEPLRHRHDWTVFTSLHAVRGWRKALRERGLDARVLAGSRVAAVGPKTADALEAIGVRPDVVPTVHRAAALVEDIGAAAGVAGSSVLFPCGTLARDELREGLRARGMLVNEVHVYDTLSLGPEPSTRAALERTTVDAWLFYCPSAVRGAIDAGLDPDEAAVVCIGPTTAAEAVASGWRNVSAAGVHTDDGVLSELQRVLDRSAVLTEVRR